MPHALIPAVSTRRPMELPDTHTGSKPYTRTGLDVAESTMPGVRWQPAGPEDRDEGLRNMSCHAISYST